MTEAEAEAEGEAVAEAEAEAGGETFSEGHGRIKQRTSFQKVQKNKNIHEIKKYD